MNSLDIQRLMQILSRLPGLGPRSGRRLTLHMLKHREQVLRPLMDALKLADQNIQTCSQCFNLDTQNPCHICCDHKRDALRLCVVSDIADVWALERAHNFNGYYHVLGGVLSAMDGVGPEQLHIEALMKRLVNSSVTEVILALNATIEGQTTMHYLASLVQQQGIHVTTLAHGMPVGGELDYLDEGTLTAAMNARHAVG